MNKLKNYMLVEVHGEILVVTDITKHLFLDSLDDCYYIGSQIIPKAIKHGFDSETLFYPEEIIASNNSLKDLIEENLLSLI